MEYSKIVNPSTGRKVNVRSKLGRKIIENYLHMSIGGETQSDCVKDLRNVNIVFFGNIGEPGKRYNIPVDNINSSIWHYIMNHFRLDKVATLPITQISFGGYNISPADTWDDWDICEDAILHVTLGVPDYNAEKERRQKNAWILETMTRQADGKYVSRN